jgi:hypothetical protein
VTLKGILNQVRELSITTTKHSRASCLQKHNQTIQTLLEATSEIKYHWYMRKHQPKVGYKTLRKKAQFS